jgi:flagellar biosynthetic protein FliR
VILQLLSSLAVAYVLVATRIAGFAAVSPFPGPYAPTQVKIGLVLLLALAATPFVPPGSMPAIGPALVVAALAEIATGVAIGFVFRVAMSAADVLGAALAHALGLTLGATFDPAQGVQVDPLSRNIAMGATLIMFATGAHRIVIGTLVTSIHAVPIGAGPELSSLAPATLGWIARSFECGLGLALPVITVSLGVQVALALVARAAPALQVFSVGLSLTLASGLLVLLTGASDIFSGFAQHLATLPEVFGGALAR